MANLRVHISGLRELGAAIREMGPAAERGVLAPGLAAMARIVRRSARVRDFGFVDRTGALRRAIRSRQIPARYGGRRYARGRSAVFAGGPGARQGYLVEAGHGGPQPAAPHPFLTRALVETQDAQLQAFILRARERFPVVVSQVAKRSGGLRRISVFGRVVARRGRRG